MTSLARQLAEHPRWEWKPGMAVLASDGSSDVVAWIETGWLNCGYESKRGGGWIRYRTTGGHGPDLEHPATKGWLLAMLREATGSVEVRVERWNDASLMRMRAPSPYDGPFWQVEAMGPYAHTIVARRDGTTEGEALASALLAAWGES